MAERLRCRGESAVADRLLCQQRTSGACPCWPARTLYRRYHCVPRHQGDGSEDLSLLSEADRRHAGGTRMVLRRLFRARSLWLGFLQLGRAPRTADGGAEKLHRAQGPLAQASRRRARGRGREDQGVMFRHCERSEAIQRDDPALDCFVALLLAMTNRKLTPSSPPSTQVH